MVKRNPALPNGAAHLMLLMKMEKRVRVRTAQQFRLHYHELEMIGTSLNALYQAATCQRGCNHGGHVFERLCGRAYNIGQGAFELTMIGLYDEALSLLRGIGEISNLVAMSIADGSAIQQWMQSDKKTRMAKFSPAKIRGLLEKDASPFLIADKTWYSDLSEKYIHPTPELRPGYHNGLDIVGGVFQETGFRNTIFEIACTLTALATMVCRYFKFDDLLAEITKSIEASIGTTVPVEKNSVPAEPETVS